MSSNPIRWLHISDFHVGRDHYGVRQMFKYILEKLKEKVAQDTAPDLIFITGDIAYGGLETEYNQFINDFFLPLEDILGDTWLGKIFVVPGNHDVDRKKAEGFEAHGILKRVKDFLDPTDEALLKRKIIFPRFEPYVKADFPDTGGTWLFSSAGAYHVSLDIRGCLIGVLCLNTALLSENDRDRHELCPGKTIIEEGLEKIKDCDVRIVLGHHPIDWFIDSWIKPIRSLFGKHNVVYLHGHLHKHESSQEVGAGMPFLVLQAGASFQAREKDEQFPWVNGMLWCELYPETGQIEVEPLQWDTEHQCWNTDSLAFPPAYKKDGAERWAFPLPSTLKAGHKLPAGKPKIKSLQLPAGWFSVDKKSLEYYRRDLEDWEVLRYFDGRTPRWSEALSPKIPRRGKVDELIRLLNDYRRTHESEGILLIGAGGEGKTTILQQVVCDLIDSESGWKVIWHKDTDTPMLPDFLLGLPKDEGTWLIASDNADIIADELFEAVKLLTGERDDIQFLLSCRDIDWKAANAGRQEWELYASFVPESITGLTLDDAQEIVIAWSRYHAKGLGNLNTFKSNLDEAGQRLYEEAMSEKYPNEGAFLGAMLRVRFGKGLRAHVKDILNKLDEIDAPGGKLLNAYRYISALHDKNLFLLTKEVLAELLGCKPSEIRKQIITPLGDEAAANVEGRYILTRHRKIAETAVEVLASAEFGEDFDEIFIELVKAARRVIIDAPHLLPKKKRGEWTYLPSTFFEKGEHDLGIRMAQALVAISPENPFLITQLAKLLRKNGEAQEALDVFRDSSEEVDADRAYYYEWGTSEGSETNFALDAWLCGVSLADGIKGPLDNTRMMISLAGLVTAFGRLFDDSNNVLYIQACGAAAQLGQMLELNSDTKDIIDSGYDKSKREGVVKMTPSNALKRIVEGIVQAWSAREADLPSQIMRGEDLTFTSLARSLKISSGSPSIRD